MFQPISDPSAPSLSPTAGLRDRKRPGANRRGERRSGISMASVLLSLLVVALATVAVGSTVVAMRAAEQRDRAKQDLTQASAGFDDLVVAVATTVKPPRKELLQPAVDYYQKYIQAHSGDKKMLPELASARFHLAALQAKLGSKEGVAAMAQGLADLDEIAKDENLDPAAFPSLQDCALKVATPVEWFMVKGADQSYGVQLVMSIARAKATYANMSKRYPSDVTLRDNHAALLKGTALIQGQMPDGRKKSLQSWLETRDVLETLVRDQPAVQDYQVRLVESLTNAARIQKTDKEIEKAMANMQRAVAVREQMAAAEPDNKTLQQELTTAKRELERMKPADAPTATTAAKPAEPPTTTSEPVEIEKEAPPAAAEETPPASEADAPAEAESPAAKAPAPGNSHGPFRQAHAVHDAKALLELIDVTRSFPGVVALRNVSLSLAAGEVHALVGENGAGKSTLINIIAGLLPPDSGEFWFRGRSVAWTNPVEARKQGIVTVHQEAELFPTLSVAENMAIEQGLPCGAAGWIHWRDIYARATRAVSVLNETIDIRQQAGELSLAQRHMTQIAAAVSQGAAVLVLDEPSSALTAGETDWLFRQIEQLKSAGVGILYISHRQEEILRLADRITVLRDGRRVWSGRSDTIDRSELIRQMVGRTRAGQIAQSRRPPAGRLGASRLTVEHLTALDGHFADVSLAARAGELLGIYGLVGAGRSEFAQALFGLRKTRSGNVEIDGGRQVVSCPEQAAGAGIAYVPEDRLRQGVFRGLSIRANMVLSALGELGRGILASAGRERAATLRQIAALDIKCRGTEQPIGQLSGGNQQKVVLARWLLTRPES